ncbi:hypothetical protein [Streptomyces fulvoviolaceus]|uniref:hypothetical protein n=1 Tax=Streptomyces fulvoviolaceus TaxID=285535 RepID=UPI0021C15B45|nr:hypothetical protein [Streptomyces fulvoviolaceus]MCT9074990.1 hypothetical protein [Streptomyces fulvoviolaceus]
MTAVGAVLALAGCSAGGSDGSGESAEPTVTSTPTMLRTADVSFPMDAYEATAEQQVTLARAQGVLTSRCMARLGFTYQAPERPVSSASGSNARVFGLVDPDTAARYGYLNPGTANAPVRAATGSLTEAEQLALSGEDDLDPADVPANLEEAEKSGGSDVTFNGERVPVGGCVRESYLKLYARKANEVDILFVFNLKSDAESKAREDSRVRAVDKRWSSCMAKAGYELTGPVNAVKELGLTESDLSSPRAVTAAKADVACKQRVNLVGVRYAVTTAYQRRLIEENAQTMSLAKEQLESRLLLAAELT